jgi:hypothetical protein
MIERILYLPLKLVLYLFQSLHVYEKNVKVMVNNFTNSNKTNHHISGSIFL